MRVVFCCGRFNPPTIGHVGLIEVMDAEAGETGSVRIFTTESHDTRRNPLPPGIKLGLLNRAFPSQRIEISASPFAAAKKLVEEGFEEATFVVGEDRARIARDIEAYGAELGFARVGTRLITRPPQAVSATLVRAAALAGDFEAFARMVPRGSDGDSDLAGDIYRAIRSGSGD